MSGPARHGPRRDAQLLRRYLGRAGVAEARALLETTERITPRGAERYGRVVAVPACAEHELLPGSLQALAVAAAAVAARVGPTLLVVVVNGRRGARAVFESNARTLEQLAASSSARRELFPGAWLGALAADVDLLVVDRASEGRCFGERDGVGLARKVGGDVAGALELRGALTTRWVHFTDADARVPADYFELPAAAETRGCAALIYPFWHEVRSGLAAGDPGARALLLYELSLRYYALGLHHAGSPYAFHTVGSTLVIDLFAYGRVHGVPRTMAGEDFHLLSKLAKVGPILPLAARDPIRLVCRPSQRVPFGTGAAMAAIGAGSLDCYAPRVFDALAAFHVQLIAAALGGASTAPDVHLKDLVDAGAAPVRAGLMRVIKTAPDTARALRQAFVKFDALRTLQFIHRVRDAGHCELPWREALRAASFVPPPEDDSLEGWRQCLWRAERSRLQGQRAGVDALAAKS